jgi:flagellar hook-basal body complex protein FliE
MSTPIGKIDRLVPGLQPEKNGSGAGPANPAEGNFSEIFSRMIDSVNSLQLDAGKAQELLATGDAADLHQVMIAAEKAGIATDLLLEIRNRLVESYQTLMRMPM